MWVIFLPDNTRIHSLPLCTSSVRITHPQSWWDCSPRSGRSGRDRPPPARRVSYQWSQSGHCSPSWSCSPPGRGRSCCSGGPCGGGRTSRSGGPAGQSGLLTCWGCSCSPRWMLWWRQRSSQPDRPDVESSPRDFPVHLSGNIININNASDGCYQPQDQRHQQ